MVLQDIRQHFRGGSRIPHLPIGVGWGGGVGSVEQDTIFAKILDLGASVFDPRSTNAFKILKSENLWDRSTWYRISSI